MGGRLKRITPNLRAEGINIEDGKIDRNRRYVRIYTQSSENLVSVISPVSPSLVKTDGDHRDKGDKVGTDFRSTTTREPDAIFEH